MAKLYFKVFADYEKVVKLREEIIKLQETLRKTDVNKNPAGAKELVTQLQNTRKEYTSLVTEASRAGATIDKDFKSSIYSASKVVNDFNAKIIEQKAVVQSTANDVKKLAVQYRAVRGTNKEVSVFKDYTSAKRALDEEKGALFGLQQEQAKAKLSVKKLRDEYSLYTKDVQESTKANFSLGKAFAVVGGVAAVKQFVSQLVNIRGQFRQIEVATETMVGKDKAKALLAENKEYAKISPLTFKDISASTQMMLGFNIEAEKVPKFIKAIGDISQGNSQKFSSLSLAFSQMSAAGKLMGQDLLKCVA